MGYLRGSGTQADPYVIHDVGAWQAFWGVTEPCFKTSAFFSIVADIDCGGIIFNGVTGSAGLGTFRAIIYGNGHHINNFSFSSYYYFNLDNQGGMYDLSMEFNGSSYGNASINNAAFSIISNCKIICKTGRFFTYSSGVRNSINLIINTTAIYTYRNYFSNSVYLVGDNVVTDYASSIRLSGASAYLPISYLTLPREKWILDGVSLPRLIPNGRSDLTTKYAIKGSTKVAGVSKKRKVAVMTAAYMGVLKNSYTDDNGNYLFDMVDASDPVYVMHYDDYGFPLAVNTAYALGSYIHPKTPNGYRYKCTTAGTSGASLPAEPWPTSSNLITGTAIFTPEPVYKTETFLVSPHLYDFLTGQPV